jgi:HTH-type transcriptional regulator / antitoxin HigA
MDNNQFDPLWTNPPGSTIARMMSLRSISAAELAVDVELSENLVHQLLNGDGFIDAALAERLSKSLGSSPSFWLKRETLYRQDIERLSAKPAVTSQEAAAWAALFPYRDMVKLGWLRDNISKNDLPRALCDFFGVSSPAEWHIGFRPDVAVAAFRTSPTYKSDPVAVATWLRWAELKSKDIDCAPWNPERLRNTLNDMRKLTRRNNPALFFKELQILCSQCGIALVIAATPTGCRASGATRFLAPDKALIVLSLRYKSDDHFWFTFFHEIGHLLLHGKDALFLEDGSEVSSVEEAEANNFSADTLVPCQFREEFDAVRPKTITVIRLAVRIGISPGVLVGQLQHAGILRTNQLNGLKRRYDWQP